jgi:hypothetical protein
LTIRWQCAHGLLLKQMNELSLPVTNNTLKLVARKWASVSETVTHKHSTIQRHDFQGRAAIAKVNCSNKTDRDTHSITIETCWYIGGSYLQGGFDMKKKARPLPGLVSEYITRVNCCPLHVEVGNTVVFLRAPEHE